MNIVNGYFSIHKWLKKQLGKASKCSNPECKSVSPKRFEWALKKGCQHEKNIDNYISLCPSCHRKYDMTDEKLENLRKPRKVSERDPVYKVAQFNKENQILEVHNSIKEAAKKTGVNRMSIYNVLAGSAKTAGKFIWKPSKN